MPKITRFNPGHCQRAGCHNLWITASERRRYCSKHCSTAVRLSEGATRRACEHCGSRYSPTWAEQRCCSKVCAGKLRNPKHFKLHVVKVRGKPRPKPRRWYAGWCGHCGDPFVSPQPGNLHCSSRCARHHERQQARAKRRAKGEYDGKGHVPRRNKIAMRDGWRCGICHRKVDKKLAYPHPKSPSLDHIVPLALGGKHEDGNLQIAHLQCNHAKGTGGTDQLRLVG